MKNVFQNSQVYWSGWNLNEESAKKTFFGWLKLANYVKLVNFWLNKTVKIIMHILMFIWKFTSIYYGEDMYCFISKNLLLLKYQTSCTVGSWIDSQPQMFISFYHQFFYSYVLRKLLSPVETAITFHGAVLICFLLLTVCCTVYFIYCLHVYFNILMFFSS